MGEMEDIVFKCILTLLIQSKKQLIMDRSKTSTVVLSGQGVKESLLLFNFFFREKRFKGIRCIFGELSCSAIVGDGISPSKPDAAADAAAAGVREFHFVVEATGHAGRGARAVHVQGFRLLRPAGWTADPVVDDCAPGDAGCPAAPPYPGPQRTYWLQVDAE